MHATTAAPSCPTFHNVRVIDGLRYGAMAARNDRRSSAPPPCAAMRRRGTHVAGECNGSATARLPPLRPAPIGHPVPARPPPGIMRAWPARSIPALRLSPVRPAPVRPAPIRPFRTGGHRSPACAATVACTWTRRASSANSNVNDTSSSSARGGFGKTFWLAMLECYYDRRQRTPSTPCSPAPTSAANPTSDRSRYVILYFDFSAFDNSLPTLEERFQGYCATQTAEAVESHPDLFSEAEARAHPGAGEHRRQAQRAVPARPGRAASRSTS